MKKMLMAIVIAVILYNAILPTCFYKIKALSIPIDINREELQMKENLHANDIIQNSMAVFNDKAVEIVRTESQGGSLVTIFFDVMNVIPIVCSTLMSIVAYPQDNQQSVITTGENAGEADVEEINRWFSISDTVFGKVDLFDIDFSKTGNSAEGNFAKDYMQTTQAEPNKQVTNDGQQITSVIKENTAKWYVAIRNLTIVFLLLVLIYVGIKMAISNLGPQKAKYQKMLLNWLVSVLLVFVLHYIIFFAIALSDALVEALQNAASSIIGVNGEKNIEQELIKGTKLTKDDTTLYSEGKILPARIGLLDALTQTNGWNLVYVSVIYWILIFYQLKFFFLYLKRFLTIGFLIVISPLITVTYAIDKAGDR